MRRHQAQADNQAVLERFQVLLIQASVDNKEKDGRHLSRTSEGVFDRSEFGQQLGGQVGGRNVLVVRRESVTLQAEGADPELASHVDLAVRLQKRNKLSKCLNSSSEDRHSV